MLRDLNREGLVEQLSLALRPMTRRKEALPEAPGKEVS
jgi:hypothetical protein